MAPPVPNSWTTDPDYIDLLNYVIQKAKDAESPINFHQLIRDFKETSGAAQTDNCLQKRIKRMRTRICKFKHIDKEEKVKLIFALSAPIETDFLEELKKDALVEVDDKKRITLYKANNGSLEFNGDHSSSVKMRTAMLASKRSLRSLIIDYFETKNNADAVPKNKEGKEMGTLIEFITEKCVNVDTPLRISRLAEDFIQHFGISTPLETIRTRIYEYCREIQGTEFLDTHSKINQLFGLSVTLDSDYLEKLRTEALVDVDEKNRITYYKASDGSLELRGDHSRLAMNRSAQFEAKRRYRSPKNEEEKEMWNLIEFITEKCKNVDSSLSLHPLAKDFNKRFGISRTPSSIFRRIKAYCHEIQGTEFLDTHLKVKQLFGLNATVDSDCLENVATTADDSEEESDPEGLDDSSDEYSSEEFGSEFDSNDGNDPLDGTQELLKSSNKAVDFDNETPVRNRSPTEMSIDTDFIFDPQTERSHVSEEMKRRWVNIDYTGNEARRTDFMEPSNEADDSDNETSVRSIAPSGISIDNNFDFDPPTERSHISEETEMREDDEKDDPEITVNTSVKTQKFKTLPKNKTSSSTVHTPKTPKRKADASESSTSKRTKPLPEESMNPGNSNDNFSHDDPSRAELNPIRGPLELSNETQKDSDIQQIPKPRPQIMEATIKKEYEEEAQTLLKTVLNAYKSLILGLDTTGLSKLQMELDTKIMEVGRIEISNKEVMMAIDFLIVKLSKHGALKSSEDSISLRDVFLMLRTIILNSSFNDLEGILEMLKENIEKLKVLDKKIPVSNVDSVLRATFEIICT